MLEALKEQVLEANLMLPRHGLAVLTWGNASGLAEDREHLVIKPSGVEYAALRAEHLVVVRVADGAVVEGGRPSSDTPAHRRLYQTLDGIAAVVHTHSPWATAWAQAGRAIPLLGTTHADFCTGPVPCTRDLTDDEVAGDFEAQTAATVVEALSGRSPAELPAVLVRGHGPFCWGDSPTAAVQHAVTLEEVAKLARYTLALNPMARLSPRLAARHFQRKHGPGAYYGQP